MSTTMISTVIMSHHTSAILLPASFTEVDGSSRMVRFDNECVLIPDPSRRSKASKTYSLPLWKKRPSDSETEATTSSSRAALSPHDTHVVIKVPIPRFISRSPSRGRSTSASPPTFKPLSPCLVYRTPSSSASPTKPIAIRRASLPVSITSKPKDDSTLTVPLRACCDECVHITEESLKEGEQWQENFSRGARRRRSASLDSSNNFGLGGTPAASGGIHHSTGFAAVALNAHGADIGPSSNPRYRASTFAITVDEVDKRRKSQEHTEEELSQFRSRSSSPRTTPVFHSPNGPYSAAPSPHIHRAVEREGSTSSTSSSISELPPHDIPPRRPKSSPIQEEDEDQLFPLPSPRRSPNNSPTPSKASSPAPSPSASTSCLSPASASRDSLSQGSSASDEGVIGKSLSRRTTSSGNKFLSPSGLQPSSLPASLLITTAPALTTFPGILTGEPPSLPQPIPLTIVTQTPARASSLPVMPLSSPSPTQSSGISPIISKLRPLPIPPSPRSPTAAAPAGAASTSPTATTPGASASRSPRTSPSVPSKARRPSFSLPAIKDAIKGASADMLKGVSSMGGGGIVGSP